MILDLNAITQIIGSLGFPIAACFAMFWWTNKQEERHREEMLKITEAVNNNTAAIIKLTERMSD